MDIHQNSEPNGINVTYTTPSNIQPVINVITAATELEMSELFNCISCNLSFANRAKFEKHMKTGHSEMKIQCPICHTLFRRQDHLRRHNRTVHCVHNTSICPVCSHDCKEEATLHLHIRECHPEETLYCTICEYSAENLQALITHKKIHEFTDKYVCNICNACFKRQDHLNRHVKSLHLQQFVTCEVCQQVFKRRDHLLRHMREQHNAAAVRNRLYRR